MTEEMIEQMTDGMNVADAFRLGMETLKDEYIDALHSILLKNADNHEKALSEIIKWLGKQVDED